MVARVQNLPRPTREPTLNHNIWNQPIDKCWERWSVGTRNGQQQPLAYW